MDLSRFPEEIIYIIMRLVFHTIHRNTYKYVLNEYNSYILEETDLGSIILLRIDGMPLLEYIE